MTSLLSHSRQPPRRAWTGSEASALKLWAECIFREDRAWGPRPPLATQGSSGPALGGYHDTLVPGSSQDCRWAKVRASGPGTHGSALGSSPGGFSGDSRQEKPAQLGPQPRGQNRSSDGAGRTPTSAQLGRSGRKGEEEAGWGPGGLGGWAEQPRPSREAAAAGGQQRLLPWKPSGNAGPTRV